MTQDIKIFLELSNDIHQLLDDNKTNIEDILQSESIDAIVTHGVRQYQTEKVARTKDLATIILASSASVIAISYAISKVITTLSNKPHFVEIYENEVLRDEQNNILLDKDGNPQLKPIKKYEFVSPRQEIRKEEFEFSFSLKNGIVIKVKSECII